MAYIKKLKNNELIGGTDNTDVYPVTSTQAVYNGNNISQEYLNNHITTDRVVNSAITEPKIADGVVSMDKLSTAVKTLIQQGVDSSWTPKGNYSATTEYDANDAVYDEATNSSYISLKADNLGHTVTDTDWWMLIMDGSDVNTLVAELQAGVEAAIAAAQEDLAEATQAANEAASAANAKIDWVTEQVNALTAYEVATALDSTSIIPVQNKVVTEEIGKDRNYIGGDVRPLAVGQVYALDETVKTSGNAMLRMTKEVKVMNTTDTVAIGDLKAADSKTWKALKDIAEYDENGEYSSGDYAVKDGVVKIFDGSDWSAATVANMYGDNTLYQEVAIVTLTSDYTGQNDVVKDMLKVSESEKEISVSDLPLISGAITDAGVWYVATGRGNYQIPITMVGGKIKIIAPPEHQFVGDFLPAIDYAPINNRSAGRIGSRIRLLAGESATITIPSGAKALCITKGTEPAYIGYSIPLKENEVVAYATEKGKTYYSGDIVFTSKEVCPSSILTYDITTASSGAVFVELLNASNTRVGTFGKGGSAWTQTHYVGQIKIPADFAYARLSGNHIIVNSIEVNVVKTYEEDGAYTEIMPLYTDGYAVVASTGLGAEVSNCGYTNYFSVIGVKKISVLAPMIGSQSYGLAFYFTPYAVDYVSGVVFSAVASGESDTTRWVDVDVPNGATHCRTTIYASSDSRFYKPKIRLYPTDYNLETYTNKSEDALCTSVMRQAKVLSEASWNYAFSSKLCICGGTAITTYDVSTALNADAPGYYDTKRTCIAKTSLLDYSTTNAYPTESAVDINNTAVSFNRAGFLTPVVGTNNAIAITALLVINNAHNAKVASVIKSVDDSFASLAYTVNRLHYNDGTAKEVEFNFSNYRQMLYDMGWTSSLVSPTGDAFDYNAITYYNGTYYSVASTYAASQSNKQMPLVILSSSDYINWTVVARIGTSLYPAAEVSAAIKDNKVYITYRSTSTIMGWVIAGIDGTLIAQGTFPVTRIMSRPYTFTYANDVYMAVNLDPTVYGLFINSTDYVHQARTEIGIYKVVDDKPLLMRRVANPTGLHYYAMCETPPLVPEGATAPLYKQGSVYMTFSEDRRRLYPRAFGNVSFADITALLANNDRVG